MKINKQELIQKCIDKFDTFKSLNIYNDSLHTFSNEMNEEFNNYPVNINEDEFKSKLSVILGKHMLPKSADIFINEIFN